MEKINSSPYKNVIYASGPRKTFIKEIEKRINYVKTTDFDDRYKQIIVNQLQSIKNLNENYNQTKKDIEYLISK